MRKTPFLPADHIAAGVVIKNVEYELTVILMTISRSYSKDRCAKLSKILKSISAMKCEFDSIVCSESFRYPVNAYSLTDGPIRVYYGPQYFSDNPYRLSRLNDESLIVLHEIAAKISCQ